MMISFIRRANRPLFGLVIYLLLKILVINNNGIHYLDRIELNYSFL